MLREFQFRIVQKKSVCLFTCVLKQLCILKYIGNFKIKHATLPDSKKIPRTTQSERGFRVRRDQSPRALR